VISVLHFQPYATCGRVGAALAAVAAVAQQAAYKSGAVVVINEQLGSALVTNCAPALLVVTKRL